MTAPIKLDPKHKNKETTGKGWSVDQFSESYTKVLRSTIILKITITIRFCMADELNGQALPVQHTNPYKRYNFQNDGTSRYFGLWLWKLAKLGLFFPVVCFIHVFDQTLAEQLYRDKGLLLILKCSLSTCLVDETKLMIIPISGHVTGRFGPFPVSCPVIVASQLHEVCRSANQHPESTIKKKSPQAFAHLVNFSKNVCNVWEPYNLVILAIEWKKLLNVLAARCAFRALFTWSRLTTCAKDHGLFILITHKSTRSERLPEVLPGVLVLDVTRLPLLRPLDTDDGVLLLWPRELDPFFLLFPDGLSWKENNTRLKRNESKEISTRAYIIFIISYGW